MGIFLRGTNISVKFLFSQLTHRVSIGNMPNLGYRIFNVSLRLFFIVGELHDRRIILEKIIFFVIKFRFFLHHLFGNS